MLELILFIYQFWCYSIFMWVLSFSTHAKWLCRLPVFDQSGVDLDYFLSIVNKTT